MPCLHLPDIKPDNILVQLSGDAPGFQTEKVLITDMENAHDLSPGRAVAGAALGNIMWRSPEAHAKGPMHLPSDMYAFGIVVSLRPVFVKHATLR